MSNELFRSIPWNTCMTLDAMEREIHLAESDESPRIKRSFHRRVRQLLKKSSFISFDQKWNLVRILNVHGCEAILCNGEADLFIASLETMDATVVTRDSDFSVISMMALLPWTTYHKTWTVCPEQAKGNDSKQLGHHRARFARSRDRLWKWLCTQYPWRRFSVLIKSIQQHLGF